MGVKFTGKGGCGCCAQTVTCNSSPVCPVPATTLTCSWTGNPGFSVFSTTLTFDGTRWWSPCIWPWTDPEPPLTITVPSYRFMLQCGHVFSVFSVQFVMYIFAAVESDLPHPDCACDETSPDYALCTTPGNIDSSTVPSGCVLADQDSPFGVLRTLSLTCGSSFLMTIGNEPSNIHPCSGSGTTDIDFFGMFTVSA
jgi:hypothetical protein